MKTFIIYGVIIVIALIFIAKVQVSFSPFKIQAEQKMYALGWLMFFSGMVIMLVCSSTSNYSRGYQKGSDDLMEIIKKEQIKQSIKEETDVKKQ